jgi:hypothetical protein
VSEQPLQLDTTEAQMRPRFNDGRDGRIDLPREVYVIGRSRVVFLSAIGHDVVFHGDQDARTTRGGATR